MTTEEPPTETSPVTVSEDETKEESVEDVKEVAEEEKADVPDEPKTDAEATIEEAAAVNTRLAPEGAPDDPIMWGRPGYLSKEEDDIFLQFREEVEKRGGDFKATVYSFGLEEGEDYALCRWLRARKYKLDLVIKMVEEATAERASAKKDDFYPDPSVAIAVEPYIYVSQYPQTYYGKGKNGCPIFYSKPGKLNINGIECLTTLTNILKYHWYAMVHDFGNRLRVEKAANPDFKRFECIIVLDLADLSASKLNSRTMSIIKEQIKIDSLCFPETNCKTLIVNSPKLFSASWSIIKGWLDARTVSKIDLISSHKKAVKKLLEIADADQVPSDYGGTAPDSKSLIELDKPSDLKRFCTELMAVRTYLVFDMSLEEGEKMEVFVYSKSTSGGTFSIKNADDSKESIVEGVKVSWTGKDPNNEPPVKVVIAPEIVGPGNFKIRADSGGGRLSYNYFLLCCNVKDA